MLETEIKNLNETIGRLIKELESLVPIVAELSKPASTPTPTSASAPKNKAKAKTKDKTSHTETPTTETSIAKTSTTKEKVEDTPTGAVTDKDLMDLCLVIVRKDRTKKAKIKEVIASFGGELIADIDQSKYAELKKELEALHE